MDVLDDKEAQNSEFFTKTDSCLVISKPETLLRVRNQGATFTCTSHVATATIFGEEVVMRQHSKQGSTQELLDYLHEYRRPNWVKENDGPFDVLPSSYPFSYKTVFNYIKDNGLSLVEEYPWNGSCKFDHCSAEKWDGKVEYEGKMVEKERKIFTKGYKRINRHDREEIEQYLRERPITGCVKLTDEFKEWSGDGMFRGEGVLVAEGMHAVTIVGYGNEGGELYFICQNSYGLDWGYKGYFKVNRECVTHTFAPYGTCSPGEKNEDDDGNSEEVGGEDDMGGHHVTKKQRI